MKNLASLTRILGLMALALSPAAFAQQIPISNIEELYRAVNDPAHAGSTLVLIQGTYVLSATDQSGAPRPNGGRIELQPDMSITGVVGDRSLVVIDAINLPKSSFPTGANGPNAAVRMGLGHNALEWLTVRNAVNAQANIDIGLQPLDPGTAYVFVAHIASTGGVRGLHLINYGAGTSGQTIDADITDSYFFENTHGIGEGMRIGNIAESQGTINVQMDHNLSWGQNTGCIIATSGSTNSTINVQSSGDRFYGNGTGTIIFGGLVGGLTPTSGADGNTINFVAQGDQFIDNTGNTVPDHGGLLVRGLENVSTATGGTNNAVNIVLWGCTLQGNTGTDLYAVGADSSVASTAPLDQNNHVIIEILGNNGGLPPMEFFANSVPGPPDYGNSVTVIDQ